MISPDRTRDSRIVAEPPPLELLPSSTRAIDRMAGYLPRLFLRTEEANRRTIVRRLPKDSGGSLLDLGTQDGEFTVRIARHLAAREVKGVELVPEHAEQARRRGIDVLCADAGERLPFADQSFDFVTANQVIEHVRDTDGMLAEVRRVLRPDGVACISTNNLSSWHNVVSLVLGFQPLPMHVSNEVIVGNPLTPDHRMPHPDRAQCHLRLFTTRGLLELASYHGLRATSVETVGFYPLPPGVARLATRLDPQHGVFLTALFARA